MTHGDQTAETDFEVELNGDGSGVDLISRSVARGKISSGLPFPDLRQLCLYRSF